MRLIGDILLKNHVERPDKAAIVFDGRVVTFRELFAATNQVSNAIEYLHGIPGNRVGILLPNCPEFVFSYFGIAGSGNIAVPINYMLQPEELVYIINNSALTGLITSSEYLPKLLEIQDRIPALRAIISTDHAANHPLAKTWKQMIDPQPTWFAPRLPLNPESVMVFLYTSGTTGFPKAAMCTHQNLLSNVEIDAVLYRMVAEDVCSCVLPMFHNYSCVENILLPFYCGCTIVTGDVEKTQDLLEKIEKHRITVLATMPMQLSEMVTLKFPRKYNTSSLRLVQSGGAALAVEVQRKFQEMFGKPIVMGYGCSEISASCTEIPLDGPYKELSVGKVIDNQKIRIVDEDDKDVPTDVDGEILVKGPNVCLGYYGMPEETLRAKRGGWFHTGDVGKLDSEGFLYVTGRMKSMINVGGFNVYPAEVEDVLHQVEGVVECCVVASRDPKYGETVKAFIEAPQGHRLNAQSIISHCEKKLAKYKVPRLIEFRDKLPRTGTGKVSFKILQAEEFDRLRKD